MVNPFHSLLKQRAAEKRTKFKKALIHFEARLGGRIFGEVPKDHRREFFCLDEHTWVWHEEWIDASGRPQALTTRYDIRHDGTILKAQGTTYQSLSPEELRNFKQAVRLYRQQVESEYRRMLGHA